MKTRLALPLLALAVMALLLGLTGGLQRLGWNLPPRNGVLILGHGPLMICGFFASLIALERAVALGQTWGAAAPLLLALGSVLALMLPAAGLALLLSGAAVLALVTALLYRRHTTLFNALLLAAVLALLLGDALWWWRGVVYLATPWWMLFLLLTITAERLELTRLLPRQRHSQTRLLWVLALLVAGALGATAGWAQGLGMALVLLGSWLLRYDIARRNLRMPGLPRYIALCLCAGYIWLLLAGAVLLVDGSAVMPGRASYDAVLHAVFLGFVFSMVFGHAPIIVPAVSGVRVRFRAWFYLPLALLHTSLVWRVVADLIADTPAWQWAGSSNVAAVLLFALALLLSVHRAAPRRA